jgi:peptidoglycan/LPS O-acetylase OafA/YrhL
MSKIGVLDGIRGLAALLVLWAHFPQIDGGLLLGYFQQASRVFYAGYLGVDIFFALSGFLITRILLKEKQSGTLSFSRFYLKRSLRIFPLYYLVIILVGVFISWENLGWSAAYLSNYYFAFDHAPNALRHTWSLCVEEHFYLFWPLVISFMSLRNSKIFIAFVIPALSIISALVALTMSDEGVLLVNKATHIRILTLSLGSLLAFHEPALKTISKAAIRSLTIVGFTLLIALSCAHFYDDILLVTLSRYITSAGLSIVFLTLLLSLSFSNSSQVFVRFFHNQVFTFFGKISYGVYLYHLPILYYFNVSHMDGATPISIQLAAFLLLLSIAIPVVSFYAFEKPILEYKDRIIGPVK